MRMQDLYWTAARYQFGRFQCCHTIPSQGAGTTSNPARAANEGCDFAGSGGPAPWEAAK